jgi:C4-dicarboxylate-specific signal transduction histidine kinase
MLVLASHLSAFVTVPLAIVIGLGLAWYWMRLGNSEVPASRRRIRRTSVVFMLTSLPMFVRGLSILESKTKPREYVLTWTMAMLMVALVMITAAIDAANNMRLHRRLRRQALEETAKELSREVKNRRHNAPATSPEANEGPSA